MKKLIPFLLCLLLSACAQGGPAASPELIAQNQAHQLCANDLHYKETGSKYKSCYEKNYSTFYASNVQMMEAARARRQAAWLDLSNSMQQQQIQQQNYFNAHRPVTCNTFGGYNSATTTCY